MKRLTACLAALGFAAMPFAAQADDITSSISGTISGALGGLGVGVSSADVDRSSGHDDNNRSKQHRVSASTNIDTEADIRLRNARVNTSSGLEADLH